MITIHKKKLVQGAIKCSEQMYIAYISVSQGEWSMCWLLDFTWHIADKPVLLASEEGKNLFPSVNIEIFNIWTADTRL